MEKLFSEIKVEDYFDKIISLINYEIDNYSRQSLETLDIDTIAEQLYNLFSIPVPKLLKEQTKSFITTEQYDETPASDGMPARPEVGSVTDIANYTIPFAGPPIFFKCIPKSGQVRVIDASVYSGEIVIKLSSQGRMVGNERIQHHIREQFNERVRQIEDALALLQEDLDKFSESLKPEIYKQLRERQMAHT